MIRWERSITKVTLEQWRVLQAVVDEGSFAKAAAKLHKSQPSISYTITKLQDMLGLTLFTIEGRRAILTEPGKQILHLSRQVTRAAKNVENAAHNFHSERERLLRLAIDEIFPTTLLMNVLHAFGLKNTYTRLIIHHGLLSGPSELLINGDAELVIVSKIPESYTGDKLLDIESLPYAHIDSPLHQKELTIDDLYDERYIIAQDSGKQNKRNEGWLGSEFHWKVSSMEMKIQCVAHGIGFSWLPRQLVENRNLPIKPIKLKQNNIRAYPLYLVHHNPEEIGPSASELIALFRHYASTI
ncbi:transcriptional regulator [Legionella lansingensis]|uniref:LysR family transporter transcriptional regulator n=1 Tax=Legionella lansingensis TaxID=45067 RepID=A0A0W0VLB0_9GAMM|nr:LysR family transcriptional regulator [Legionella lansingensis]KTD20927.1 LysR family transporter transcriptional regulator [Legionella lansingensis]SNV44328.1 transcriptional regulator [Legionella lansingensis]